MRHLITKSLIVATVVTLGAAAQAATPFRIEIKNAKQKLAPLLEASGAGQVLAAPPSDVDAQPDHFFIYLNGEQDSDGMPSQPDCNVPLASIAEAADCFSLTAWVERSVDMLMQYEPFQNQVQALVDELLDDPATPEPDPLLDEALAVPLLGDFNLGFYIQDLWDDVPACGSGTQANPDLDGSPKTLANPNRTIGCKYGDDDTRAVDLIGEVFDPIPSKKYTVSVRPQGSDDGGAPMPTNDDAEGSLKIRIALNNDLDADVIFRQPDFALNITEGYYLHAAGKIRLRNLAVEVEAYIVGGNLRGLIPIDASVSPGYGVGLDFERIFLTGEVLFDMDGYDCGTLTHNDPRVFGSGTTPVCDASVLDASHPDAGDQAGYQLATNEINSLLTEALKYLEVNMVYEAVRATGVVADYLTGVELLDLQELTHEITGGTIYKPSFEHPFTQGDKVYLDYGVFWQFNGEADEGIDMPGGFGLDVTFPAGSECSAGNPMPAPPYNDPDMRIPAVSTPALFFDRTKANRNSMLGVGINLNPLNRAVDTLWEERVLCSSIYPGTPNGIGEALADILKADTFRMFLPSLSQNFDGRDMMLRIVPRYVSPGSLSTDYNPAVDQLTWEYNPADPPVCDDPLTSSSPRPCLINGTQWDSSNPGGYFGPFDLALNIPHIELQMLIDALGDGQYTSFSQILGMEVEAAIYLGAGWYRLDAASAALLDGYDISSDVDCVTAPYPCRVLRISVLADARLRDVYDYNTAAYFDQPGLQDAIASLVGIALSGIIQGRLQVVTNLASEDLLGFAIDPGVPNSGSLAIWNREFAGQTIEPVDLDGDTVEETLGLFVTFADLNGGFDPQGDPIPGSDGYADPLSPKMIMDLLTDLGLFSLGAAPPLGQTQVEVEAHTGPDTFWHLGDVAYGADVELTREQVEALGLLRGNVLLTATAWNTTGQAPQEMQYHYRIDNGPYVPSVGGFVRVPYLFDGTHTLEVAAIDAKAYLDPTPARLTFTIDREGPRIRYVGETRLLGQGGEVKLGLDVHDLVSAPEELSVQWRIDEGEWQTVRADGVIATEVTPGAHSLQIRATDPSGNVTERSLEFVAEQGGFGCNSGTGGSPWAWILMLTAPLWYVRRQRIVDAQA